MGTVTLKDLAAKLGLSVTTISQALGGYGNAAQTTRHWARAAREMGYAPTLLPRQFHNGPANTLFVPLPLSPVSPPPLFSRLLVSVGR